MKKHFFAIVMALSASFWVSQESRWLSRTPPPRRQGRLFSGPRIEGIPGDSVVDRHKGDIDIEPQGPKPGQLRPVRRRSCRTVKHGSFRFSAPTSQASPRLVQAARPGRSFGTPC